MSLMSVPTSEASRKHNSSKYLDLSHERFLEDKLALTHDMLGKVISRAKVYGSGNQRRRYVDYSPEDVYRAVGMLVDEKKSLCLQDVLEDFLKDYSAYITGRLTEFAQKLGLLSPPSGAAASDDNTPESNRDESFQAEVSEGLIKTEKVAVKCFHELMDIWESFSFAMEEIQVVWSPFAYRYILKATIFKGMAGATVSFLMDGFNEVPVVLEAALEGFVQLMRSDIEMHGAPPSVHGDCDASLVATTGVTTLKEAGEDRKVQKTRTDDDDHRHNARQSETNFDPITARLRRFTEFLFMTQRYVHRLQPMILTALTDFYSQAAMKMYQEELPSPQYFSYVKEALLGEKRRGNTYLYPQTSLLLQEVVEREMLGAVGMEILERDLALLLDVDRVDEAVGTTWKEVPLQSRHNPAATAAGGLETLVLAWRLLSRSTQVSKDPLVTMFRKHIQSVAMTHAMDIARLQKVEANAEACRCSVYNLLRFIAKSRQVVAWCFPNDQKLFRIQIDEGLQVALNKYQRPVAEQLAAFADYIFGMMESGVLLLGGHAPPPLPEAQHAQLLDSNNGNNVCQANDVFNAQNEEAAEEHNHLRTIAKVAQESGVLARATPSATPNEGGFPTLVSGREFLEQIAFTCVHFQSNDVFGHLHWQDLTRRLLSPSRAVNLSAERCFLRLFEGIYGSSFIYKFEGMLKDRETSEDLMKQYELWVHSKGAVLQPGSTTSEPPLPSDAYAPPVVSAEDFDSLPNLAGMELRLFLMTTGYWPKRGDTMSLQLQPPLQRLTTNIELFYRSLYPNRHLVWQHQLSHGVLRAQLSPGADVYELSGTFIQCIVLMHFDQHSFEQEDPQAREGAGSVLSLSVQELCQQLGLDLDIPEVMGSLMGLCQEHFQLLIRTSAGGTGDQSMLSPQDSLQLNTAFACASHCIHIPFPVCTTKPLPDPDAGVAQSNDKSAVTSEEQLWQEHSYALQIAIIQFMKKKFSAKHDEILAHVLAQKYNFEFGESFVKKSIEKLLDRGFMERSGRDQYKYLA